MKQDIRSKDCLIHNQVCVAIDMNPLCSTPERNLCVECLKNPIKSRNSLSFDQASHYLYNKKKAFKFEQETQNQHNLNILKDLSQMTQVLKNDFNKIFDQVQQNIDDQVMFIENTQQYLNEQWDEVDIDQFFSSGQNFILKSFNKKLFEKNLQQILGYLFEQNIFKDFKEKLKNIDDKAIQPQETVENKSEIKVSIQKKFKLQFLCDEHQEEVRMYDQNKNTPRENRIICDECTLDRDGPFIPLLTIYKKWEEYKINKIKQLDTQEEALNQQVQQNQNQLFQVKDNFLNKINELQKMLIEQQERVSNQNQQERDHFKKQWQTLSKEEVVDIVETLNKTGKNSPLNSSKSDTLQSDNQITQMIQEQVYELQSLINSLFPIMSDDRTEVLSQKTNEIKESKNYELVIHKFPECLDFKGLNKVQNLNVSIINSNYKKDKMTLKNIETQTENYLLQAKAIEIDFFEFYENKRQNQQIVTTYYIKRTQYKEIDSQTQKSLQSNFHNFACEIIKKPRKIQPNTLIINMELINQNCRRDISILKNQKELTEQSKTIDLLIIPASVIPESQLAPSIFQCRTSHKLSFKSQEMSEQIQIFKPINFEINEHNSISMQSNCYAIGFYSKCSILVTGQTRQITIYDFKFGHLQRMQVLDEHGDHVVSFCFMNNTTNFVSGSWDSTIRVWKLNNINKLWYCEQVLQDSGYVNQIIINKQEDLLISCGFAKQIRFWQKKTQWECIQVLRAHSSKIWSICLNESCNQLVSCGEDSQIVISMLGDQNLWKVVQVIEGCNGFRLCFISDQIFCFQPKFSKKMDTYQMNSDKQIFEKTKETKIEQDGSNCEKFFPMVYIKKRQILLNHNGNRVNIMRKLNNNEFIIEQSIKFQISGVYGTISDDGQYLMIFDSLNNKLQIWEQK